MRPMGYASLLDSVGAFLGPLLAIAFMALWANDIKTVLWVAVFAGYAGKLLKIKSLVLASVTMRPSFHSLPLHRDRDS